MGATCSKSINRFSPRRSGAIATVYERAHSPLLYPYGIYAGTRPWGGDAVGSQMYERRLQPYAGSSQVRSVWE